MHGSTACGRPSIESRCSFTGPLTDHSSSGIPRRLVFGCCSAVVKPIRMSADPKLVAPSGQPSIPPLELPYAGLSTFGKYGGQCRMDMCSRWWLTAGRASDPRYSTTLRYSRTGVGAMGNPTLGILKHSRQIVEPRYHVVVILYSKVIIIII